MPVMLATNSQFIVFTNKIGALTREISELRADLALKEYDFKIKLKVLTKKNKELSQFWVLRGMHKKTVMVYHPEGAIFLNYKQWNYLTMYIILSMNGFHRFLDQNYVASYFKNNLQFKYFKKAFRALKLRETQHQ